MRILLIEDNPDLVANIFAYFETLNFIVDAAYNGVAGLEAAKENEYDVIILDVMLPGLNGYELCRKLRSEFFKQTPVIMLTAKDTVDERVEGFHSGADDYLIKPFSLAELQARMEALVRRSKHELAGQCLQLGELSLSIDTREVVRAGKRIKLTPIGYTLLKKLLLESPGVVSASVLEQEIWGDDIPNSSALRTHIHTVRQELDKPFAKSMLKTVPGFGYHLVDTND